MKSKFVNEELSLTKNQLEKIQSEHDEESAKKSIEHEKAVEKLKVEVEELTEDRNKISDEKYAQEAVIDKKQAEIEKLTIELRKSVDEVELRKVVEEQISVNLLKHEDDNMNLTQKLALMKNQIMEYDRYLGINRKYGAVRYQTLKNTAVTVSPACSL